MAQGESSGPNKEYLDVYKHVSFKQSLYDLFVTSERFVFIHKKTDTSYSLSFRFLGRAAERGINKNPEKRYDPTMTLSQMIGADKDNFTIPYSIVTSVEMSKLFAARRVEIRFSGSKGVSTCKVIVTANQFEAMKNLFPTVPYLSSKVVMMS